MALYRLRIRRFPQKGFTGNRSALHRENAIWLFAFEFRCKQIGQANLEERFGTLGHGYGGMSDAALPRFQKTGHQGGSGRNRIERKVRSAQVLIREHGEDAAIEAAQRAATMLERGDMEGAAV